MIPDEAIPFALGSLAIIFVMLKDWIYDRFSNQ